MSEQTENSVYAKLLKVMRDVKRIHKTGHNSFHNYDYATEQDIKEAVGTGFREHGLVMWIKEIGDHEIGPEQTTKDGRVLRSWYYPVTFVVADPDTGHEIRSTFKGQGDDSDKSLWKAITGAIKYFLTSLLLIPTGDDPERDGAPTNNKEPATKPQGATPARDATPSLPPAVECVYCGNVLEGDAVKAIRTWPANYAGKGFDAGEPAYKCRECSKTTAVREPSPVPAKDPSDDLPF